MDRLSEIIKELEERIGYTFKNKDNLILAITHSSYANENKSTGQKNNERLEFLGDSVLNLVITEALFTNYANLTEGEMTKARASIVCEASLLKCSNSMGIGKYLLLGKGEELTGGRARISILSDAFESLIGAVYIDGGIKYAREFITEVMNQLISDSVNGAVFMDYKTELQEILQKDGDHRIIYEIVEERGPDHNKIFVSQLIIGDIVKGIGEGKSKKEAEQNAAKSALEGV